MAMFRSQRWQKSHDGFLARGKGPPQEELPLSGNPAASVATENPDVVTVRSTEPSLQQEQLDGTHSSSTAALQAFDKRAVVIYKDDKGHCQLEASPTMLHSLDPEGSKKLLQCFEEVFEGPHASQTPAPSFPRLSQSLNAGRLEDFPEVNTTANSSSGNINENVVRRETVGVAEGAHLREWYIYMFKLMQQCPCKHIAKALITKIHPKKSGSHPYNGGKLAKTSSLTKQELGNLTKPYWWPPEVDHMEPDHLDMYQRVFLLVHIVARMYHILCGADLKTRVTVEFLRDAVNEVQAKILRLENGERAWQLWQQVLSVRAVEEQYLNGEIPTSATTLSIFHYEFPKYNQKRAPRRTELSEDIQKDKRSKRKRQRRSIKSVVMQSSADELPSLTEDSYAGSGEDCKSTSLASVSGSSEMPTTLDAKSETHLNMASWRALHMQLKILPHARAGYNGAAPIMDPSAPSAVDNTSYSTGGDALRSLGGSDLPNMLSLPNDSLAHNQYQTLQDQVSMFQNGNDSSPNDSYIGPTFNSDTLHIQLWPQGGRSQGMEYPQTGAAQQHNEMTYVGFGQQDDQVPATPTGANQFRYGYPVLEQPSVDESEVPKRRSGNAYTYHGL